MAQNQENPKYWILLKDKPNQGYDYRQHLSPAAIEKRQQLGIPLHQMTDIPLNKEYIQQLRKLGIKAIAQSKWLNAVSANLTATQIEQLQQLPFVKELILMKKGGKAQSLKPQQEQIPTNYTYATSQLQPEAFQQYKLNAKGVRIGVIDAGFHGALKNRYLSHLFSNKQILEFRDFLNPDREKSEYYTQAMTHSDWHGTRVLQLIAGQDSSSGQQFGFATEALFYLARTEDGSREFRGEEDRWVSALEWMDSLGVRIINTSLGYADNFDKKEENYSPKQMDGQTAIITKAANIAVKEKGLFLVASAGNEGSNSNWRVVSAPADSEDVIAVGATNKVGMRAGYSSYGPNFLPYTKPDVSCYAPDGTSFAAPIITGFVSCLIQQFPNKNQAALAEALKASSSLYPYGNLSVGYGLPQADRAIAILEGSTQANEPSIVKMEVGANQRVILKNTEAHAKPYSTAILLFHKQGRVVYKTQVLRTKGKKIKVKKPDESVTQTTILYPDFTGIEVFW